MSGAELAHPRPGGVPPAVLWVIRCMNLIFNFLNALWFSKMLKGAIKVSPPPCTAHKCCYPNRGVPSYTCCNIATQRTWRAHLHPKAQLTKLAVLSLYAAGASVSVLHDTGICKTSGATVTRETFIILQCSACKEVPQPRSVDCHPSVRLSRKKQRPIHVSNGRVGFFLPCLCHTDLYSWKQGL